MKKYFKLIYNRFITEVKLKLYRISFLEKEQDEWVLWEYLFNGKLIISLKTNFPDTRKKFVFINEYRDRVQQVQSDFIKTRYQKPGNVIQDLYKLLKLKLK